LVPMSDHADSRAFLNSSSQNHTPMPAIVSPGTGHVYCFLGYGFPYCTRRNWSARSPDQRSKKQVRALSNFRLTHYPREGSVLI
jgi:hypothetical protein